MPPVGFIQDELDLKLLVLYIMDRVAGPVTFLQLFDLALCDAGVDYFSLTRAVDHMVATGQLSKEEERYAITDKGRRNSQICESSLPHSVRGHCDDNLVKVNEALRLEAQVCAQVTPNEDGTACVNLRLNDGDSSLFALELLASDQQQGQRWVEIFRQNPSGLYLEITRLLDRTKEEKP